VSVTATIPFSTDVVVAVVVADGVFDVAARDTSTRTPASSGDRNSANACRTSRANARAAYTARTLSSPHGAQHSRTRAAVVSERTQRRCNSSSRRSTPSCVHNRNCTHAHHGNKTEHADFVYCWRVKRFKRGHRRCVCVKPREQHVKPAHRHTTDAIVMLQINNIAC
jgi:hypothetical protein